MAYTNPWDNSYPPGSAAANTLDTIIQRIELAIQERMDTVIGEALAWFEDPVIDGTTIKSLKQLTDEIATKSTITGLTTGQLIVATSATTIGDAGITVADLADLFSPATVEVQTNNPTIPFLLEGGVGACYLLTYMANEGTGASNGVITFGSNGSPNLYEERASHGKAIATVIINLPGATVSGAADFAGGTGVGEYTLVIKRIG